MRISDWSSDVCSSDLLVTQELKVLRMPEKMRLGHDNGLDDLVPQILVDVERGQEGVGAPEPAAPDLLGDRPLHHGKAVHRTAEAEATAERREDGVGTRRRRRRAPHGPRYPLARPERRRVGKKGVQ